MKNIVFLILIVFLTLSCKKSIDNNKQNSYSGKFALLSLSNLKSSKSTVSDDLNFFDLDTIKSSRSYFFILGNSGQGDITNIKLTSDNNSFIVTPSTIAILPGTSSTVSSTVTQVISLDVIHGTRINGVGYTGLLNMGNNSCILYITGQTTDGTNTINISYKAKIQVFAKVMNVTLSQGNREFDFTKPDGGVVGLTGVSEAPMFNCNSATDVYLKNTGNVSILFNLLGSSVNFPIIQSSILKSNESILLNLPTNSQAYVQLNSQGTIFDQTKFAMGADGNGYFGLAIQSNSDTPINPPIDSSQVNKVKKISNVTF